MVRRSGSRATILVVDDDPSVVQALHIVFDDAYEVLDACDGETALAAIRSRDVNLVLLDLVLVGMDGIAVMEHLRASGFGAPIVVVSGLNTAWTAATAMRLGAVDYITKPFDEEHLLNTVNFALQRAREAAELHPPSEVPKILLIGLDPALAAAFAVALTNHANVEAIPASGDMLVRLPMITPDVIVINGERVHIPRDFVARVRVHFPAAPIVLTNAPPADRSSGTVRPEVITLLPKRAPLLDLLEAIKRELRPSVRPIPSLSPRVIEVVEYVASALANVVVRDLGTRLGKSPYYLSRLFRVETGSGLKSYVTRVRVEAARLMLLESTEKLEVVAGAVGLHDASHLSRLFLRYAGQRPGHFRRTWWSGSHRRIRR